MGNQTIWGKVIFFLFNSSLQTKTNFQIYSPHRYRQEKANAIQPVTRTSTGKLPTRIQPHSTASFAADSSATTSQSLPTTPNNMKIVVSSKATPEEIKERMEQQLRIQRAAHHQKRALEMQKQGKYYMQLADGIYLFRSFYIKKKKLKVAIVLQQAATLQTAAVVQAVQAPKEDISCNNTESVEGIFLFSSIQSITPPKSRNLSAKSYSKSHSHAFNTNLFN